MIFFLVRPHACTPPLGGQSMSICRVSMAVPTNTHPSLDHALQRLTRLHLFDDRITIDAAKAGPVYRLLYG